MKNTNTIYWILTGLFAAFMLSTAIPDILVVPDAKILINHLGYPEYFLPFIGVMKLLGVVAVLVPGYPRIKEWAYAGIFFDLLGATYSQIATDGFQLQVTFMVLPFPLFILSYRYYNKRLRTNGDGEQKIKNYSECSKSTA